MHSNERRSAAPPNLGAAGERVQLGNSGETGHAQSKAKTSQLSLARKPAANARRLAIVFGILAAGATILWVIFLIWGAIRIILSML